MASLLLAFQFSSRSEPELFALSFGFMLLLMFSTYDRDEERFVALLGSISRKGEWSESDEKLVNVGGGGDPSDFFVRKPALNRLCLGFDSSDGMGGAGMGEEPVKSKPSTACSNGALMVVSEDWWTGDSENDASDLSSVRCGDFSNSASVPWSVSSRHRTPHFSSLPGDFFFGVNDTPFLTAAAFRRLGEDRAGEPKLLGM